VELRQLLRILRRRWKLVVATFLIGIIGAATITASITPTYRSEARIYVTASAASASEAYALSLYSQQRIASYAELATDPDLLERVIRTVGLTTTSQALAGHISATPVPSTVILAVSATDGDPQIARKIARAEAAEVVKLIDNLETPSKADKDAKVVNVAPVVAQVAGDATYSANPVSPHFTLNLIIGGLLGLLFGFAGAVMRELFDTSIKTPDGAAKAAGAAVMAVIPFDSSVPKQPLISDKGGSGERIDAFSVLRTNLQFVDLDSKHQVLIVSSPLPDEGKTVTSTNLAITLAQTGRRVLIMDCDFRRPRVARILGLENSVGLLTVMVGHAQLEDCIQQHASGCDFLATGPHPPNPTEILETQAMADLLLRVRESYDVVIIDAPPLLPVADPAIIAAKVDGVLLVVRHGKTSVEAVHHAVDRIDTVGGRVVGVVLNMMPRRAMAGYGYGYGYGYGDVEWPGSNNDVAGKRARSTGRRSWRARDRAEVTGRSR
jgi:receptor protein-tyrosine kinase